MKPEELVGQIRRNMTRDDINRLNARAPLDSGVKVACEIALGVRPGCEGALEQARDVVAAALACGYGVPS